MDHIDYAYTFGMDADTLEARLRETETGVLALSRGNESYAFPVAHHYDGEALYFRLGVTEGSEKRAFLEATETACYVVYGTETTDDPREIDSWSVLVTGQLSEVPASERDRFGTAQINRDFSPIRVFDEAIDEMEVTVVELKIDAIIGRATGNG